MLKNSTDKSLMAYDYRGACAFYLAAVIVTLLCQAAAGIFAVALDKPFPGAAKSGEFNTAFMIAVQCVNGLFIYFYTRTKHRKFDFTFVTDGDRGVTPAVIMVPVAAAGVLMCAMYLPTVWYGYLVRAIGLPAGYGDVPLDSVPSVVMIALAAAVLAPVMEETIYRGVLLSGLRREKSVALSVVLAALAFMLMHMNPQQVVFQFALGVASGYTAVMSGRLLPSIILHASANALALVMELTALNGVLAGCETWLTGHVTAAVFITLGLLASGMAVLFCLIRFGFGSGHAEECRAVRRAKPGAAETESVGGDADAQSVNAVAAIRRDAVRGDGTFLYIIGVSICALMLIVNLITGILS